MVLNGVEYLDEDAELFPDGSVHDATLARDTVIQGLPCAGGCSVVFFPSGQLRLAWLARPTAVGAVSCSPGLVYLHENGGLLNATLAVDWQFEGLVVPAGARVTLDPVGQLLEYSRRLEADQSIEGLRCAAGWDVWIYPNGCPSLVVLAQTSIIDGREFPPGTELFLNENGGVIDCHSLEITSGRQYKQRVFGVYEFPFQ